MISNINMRISCWMKYGSYLSKPFWLELYARNVTVKYILTRLTALLLDLLHSVGTALAIAIKCYFLMCTCMN